MTLKVRTTPICPVRYGFGGTDITVTFKMLLCSFLCNLIDMSMLLHIDKTQSQLLVHSMMGTVVHKLIALGLTYYAGVLMLHLLGRAHANLFFWFSVL